MATGKVTKTTVEGLAPLARDKNILWDTRVAGFGAYVTPKGTRGYILQYRMGGRAYPTRTYTIGHHGSPWTPERARERARELLYLIDQGTDPMLQKKQERTAAQVDERLRFSNYLETFDKLYLQARKLRTASQVRNYLVANALPTFGDQPINTITKRQIIILMDTLSERSKSTANHTFSSLSAMMNFALRRSDIDKNPLAGLEKHKIEKRQRVLSDWELMRIWEAAEDMGFPEGIAIQMLILTAQRKNEVAHSSWQEFDLSNYTWTLPPHRTKNKRTHIIPITEQMLAFFDKHWPAETRHGPLFPGERGRLINSFSAMKTRLDAYSARRVELAGAAFPPNSGQTIEHFVFHDLRRTVVTGMAILGVPVDHTEAILNHRDGARSQLVETYQVYDLAPEKQRALAKWHKHLDGLIQREDAWPGGKELLPLQVRTRKSNDAVIVNPWLHL